MAETSRCMAVCSRDTQGHCVPSAAHAQAWCGLTATPSPPSSSLLLISAPDRTMWFLHPAHNLLCCAVPSLLRVLGDALHPAAAFLAHPPPPHLTFPFCNFCGFFPHISGVSYVGCFLFPDLLFLIPFYLSTLLTETFHWTLYFSNSGGKRR